MTVKNLNKRIVIVFSGLGLLFILLVLYLTYFQLFQAEDLASNKYNQRNRVDELVIKRGSISDANGLVLATSNSVEGGYKREYVYGPLYSHIIGYNSTTYGKTGLESSYNDILLNVEKAQPLSNLREKVIKNDIGKDLKLTLIQELQQLADQQLEGHKGSIVLINPQTGAVYAMVSRPNFDPNTVETNWDSISTSTESPLLNRSAQGLYTPGSVVKIITATALIEHQDKIDLSYEDTGTTVIDGYKISNFEDSIWGDINLRTALVHSVNTYFADKAVELGGETMNTTFENFMFNKKIPFDIVTATSKSPFTSKMGKTDLAAAAFGQGETLVTPLNMALSVAALANGGKMMQPYIVKEVIDAEGVRTPVNPPKILAQVTTEDFANTLKEDMVAVIEYGSRAQIDGVTVGGKTGTAETASGLDHAWFVGFAPAENPKFAVAVILEEDGTLGGKTAAPIGGEILKKALNTTIE